ncbi:MAG: hypothetical protein ACRC6U_07175 [Fusobacteriaceae bacterium]
MRKMEKIEFRTLRASKKTNKGTTIILTPSSTGDIVFEMALLKGFNENDKPTYDYSTKAVFSLGMIEASKVALSVNKFLLVPAKYAKKIEFNHSASKSPKKITFDLALNPNGEPQMQVNVYVTNESKAFNIYLNEEEMNCIRLFLESQVNPAQKYLNMLSGSSFKVEKENLDFKNDDLAFKSAAFDKLTSIENILLNGGKQ